MNKAKTTQCCDISQTLVPAGGANGGFCGMGDELNAGLARISFEVQQYSYGLCPDEALRCGTLFPELINAG